MLLGITGGSGIYNLSELVIDEKREIWTPYGKPSSPLVLGRINGNRVVFLSRHGEGHTILPHQINYRANIWALKSVGVTHLAALSAVGSLKEELVPGEFVVVDQFIDLTRRRSLSLYDDVVVHVSIADPVCKDFSTILALAGKTAGGKIHRGGTYVCIDGPQFSTRAESNWYRSMNASVIGMTNVTEARLAREAEIHFATMAMITDYDCWRVGEEDVTVESVLDTIRQNGEFANRAVVELSSLFYNGYSPDCTLCGNALEGAIMNSPGTLSNAIKEKYNLLLGRFLSEHSAKDK